MNNESHHFEQISLPTSDQVRTYSLKLEPNGDSDTYRVKLMVHDPKSGIAVLDKLDFKHQSPNGVMSALRLLWETIERDENSKGREWPDFWEHRADMLPF